jgi:hypothetical protein
MDGPKARTTERRQPLTGRFIVGSKRDRVDGALNRTAIRCIDQKE